MSLFHILLYQGKDHEMKIGKRTLEMQSFIDNFSKYVFGLSQTEAREQKICINCMRSINGREDFRDDISWREYQIASTCQKCQDDTYERLKEFNGVE
jgi:hypothetical protein